MWCRGGGLPEAALLQCRREYDDTATIFRCRGVVTVLSYHLRRDGQRRAIDAAAAGSHQSLSHPCPIACALVANLLGTRSKIIGLDFEDSREGCQTKNCPSGLTLAD